MMCKQMFLFSCAVLATTVFSSGQTQPVSPTNPVAIPIQPIAPSLISVNEVTPITATTSLSITNADGTVQPPQTGQYYRSHDGRVREDLPAGSVITDRKAGTITTLNPTTLQAIVKPTPGPKGRYVARSAPTVTPTTTVLGQTTVEGHPVTMTSITITPSNGTTAEIWTATDLRLTVLLKATRSDGQITSRQYSNLQTVEPDPSVFTIPSNYTVVTQTQTTTTPVITTSAATAAMPAVGGHQ